MLPVNLDTDPAAANPEETICAAPLLHDGSTRCVLTSLCGVDQRGEPGRRQRFEQRNSKHRLAQFIKLHDLPKRGRGRSNRRQTHVLHRCRHDPLLGGREPHSRLPTTLCCLVQPADIRVHIPHQHGLRCRDQHNVCLRRASRQTTVVTQQAVPTIARTQRLLAAGQIDHPLQHQRQTAFIQRADRRRGNRLLRTESLHESSYQRTASIGTERAESILCPSLQGLSNRHTRQQPLTFRQNLCGST
mmetsp:Transcript_112631/g.257996  ORF Transcript_112631/g.257996 Transcript_112631/m.257996 type:complete len:245 (-) Transcript_112631:418-1152(-)